MKKIKDMHDSAAARTGTENTVHLLLRMAGSFLDMPSLTLPTGLNAHGLPAALMVSATSGRDETVLAAGKLFAQILTNDQVLNRMRMQAC